MQRIRIVMLALLVVLAALAIWRDGPNDFFGAAAQPDAPVVASVPDADQPLPASTTAMPDDDGLPGEARTTLALIAAGGPFPFDRDGLEFRNFEHRLPERPRGWYHEYTVPTPGLDHRGARRIVTGGNPPSEWWYSDDHYGSFRAIGGGR
jgi:ribonuclease T1